MIHVSCWRLSPHSVRVEVRLPALDADVLYDVECRAPYYIPFARVRGKRKPRRAVLPYIISKTHLRPISLREASLIAQAWAMRNPPPDP